MGQTIVPRNARTCGLEESGSKPLSHRTIKHALSNEPQKEKNSESPLISVLAKAIAGLVRLGRVPGSLMPRFGKKRARFGAPELDVTAAPRVAPAPRPAASPPPAPATIVSQGQEEGPVEVYLIPNARPPTEAPASRKVADFQAPESAENKDYEMLARIQARKRSPRPARHLRAIRWKAGRKVVQLHRHFPIWMVAIFYLLCAGTLSVLVSFPFLTAPATVITKAAPTPGVPEKEDPRRLLGEIAQLITSKDYNAAQKKLETLREIWPNDPRVYQIKGALLAGKKDYIGARKAFEQARELEPQSRSVLFNLAEVDFVSGNYAAAEAGYKTLAETWNKNGMILFRLYLCSRLLKQDKEAAEIETDPALSQESVEWLYVQAAKNFFDQKKRDAAQYVEKARVLYPEDGEVYELTLQRLGLLK